MGKVCLTPESTPNVERITMEHPSESDSPDFQILCPKLKHFSCYHWGPGEDDWVNDMLASATKLESFDSYKFRPGYLRFASNHLDKIRLHRAECLEVLEIYAPRLTKLDLQAAYDLDQILFHHNHSTLSRKLPPDFRFTKELQVNSFNALLGSGAKRAIRSHPRFHGELEEDDDDDDYDMYHGPRDGTMEGFLADMHSRTNGEEEDDYGMYHGPRDGTMEGFMADMQRRMNGGEEDDYGMDHGPAEAAMIEAMREDMRRTNAPPEIIDLFNQYSPR